LILRKIITIVATRCHILRLKCTKFDFGCGSAPDPTGGAHSAPPVSLAGFKGSYFYRKGRREREKGEERGGWWRRRGREGKEGRGRGIMAFLGCTP